MWCERLLIFMIAARGFWSSVFSHGDSLVSQVRNKKIFWECFLYDVTRCVLFLCYPYFALRFLLFVLLGNNPTDVCKLCTGQNKEFCTTSDKRAGFDGAFRCVAERAGDLTFLRHDTVQMMTDPVMNPGTTYTSAVCFFFFFLLSAWLNDYTICVTWH